MSHAKTDTALLLAAERASTGANVHRIAGLVGLYKGAVALLNRHADATGAVPDTERVARYRRGVLKHEVNLRRVLGEIASAEWERTR